MLCERGISVRIKGTAYKVCAMCHGAEMGLLRVEDVMRLETTKMLGIDVWKKYQESYKNQLMMWFGHVERMSKDKTAAAARIIAGHSKKFLWPNKR